MPAGRVHQNLKASTKMLCVEMSAKWIYTASASTLSAHSSLIERRQSMPRGASVAESMTLSTIDLPSSIGWVSVAWTLVENARKWCLPTQTLWRMTCMIQRPANSFSIPKLEGLHKRADLVLAWKLLRICTRPDKSATTRGLPGKLKRNRRHIRMPSRYSQFHQHRKLLRRKSSKHSIKSSTGSTRTKMAISLPIRLTSPCSLLIY